MDVYSDSLSFTGAYLNSTADKSTSFDLFVVSDTARTLEITKLDENYLYLDGPEPLSVRMDGELIQEKASLSGAGTWTYDGTNTKIQHTTDNLTLDYENNYAPTVENLKNTSITRTSADLSADAYDPDSDDLSWVTIIDNSDGSVLENENAGPYTTPTSVSYSWTGLSENSDYSWYVMAEDSYGDVSTSSVQGFTTEANYPVEYENADNSAITRTEATLSMDALDQDSDDIEWLAFLKGDESVIENIDTTYSEPHSYTTTYSGLSEDTAYDWNVQAKYSFGNTSTSSTYTFTTSADNPPTALFTENSPKLTSENIYFDASDSTDDYSITSYEWDWTNDGSYEGSGENTSHSFLDNGTYTVKLRVTDDSGQTDTTTDTVTINNRTPTADSNYSVTDLTVDVDASGSSDDDGSISSYEWEWKSGDGFNSGTETDSHTYASEGTYDVTLRVTDDDGATDTVTKSVSVSFDSPATVENLTESSVDRDSAVLNVDVGDPEDDTIEWMCFKKGDGTIIDNQDVSDSPPKTYSTTYSGLSPSTSYDWKVQAKTSGTTTSSTYTFTTDANILPTVENENPTDGTTGTSVDTNLQLDVSDPEGDSVTVDLHWDNGDSIGSDTVSGTGTASVSVSNLNNSENYYWYADYSDAYESDSTAVFRFGTVEVAKKPEKTVEKVIKSPWFYVAIALASILLILAVRQREK